MERTILLVAASLGTLALLAWDQGKQELAQSLAQRALAIDEKALGSEHPQVGVILSILATWDVARKHLEQALPRLRRAQQIQESQLSQAASEPRVTSLLNLYRWQEEQIYGLLLENGQDAELRTLTLTVSLLRKGRALEAGAQASRAILESLATPLQRASHEKWQRLRAERERLLLAGPGSLAALAYRGRLDTLRLQIDELEHDLVASSPRLRSIQLPRWNELLPLIAGKLPRDSVLLEVVLSTQIDYRGMGPATDAGRAHYLAMLLYPDARIEVADLGDAQAIGDAAAELLKQIQVQAQDPKPAAQALYQKVMAPLQARLSGVSRLYLSLDGSLNLVPFAALHDGRQYLIDQYQFHYLTSGRDLLREPAGQPGPPLILADPDYAAALPVSATDSRRAVDVKLQSLYARLRALPRLPATRLEATHIARLLARAEVRLDADASEQALRQVKRCASGSRTHTTGHPSLYSARTDPSAPCLPLPRF